MIRRPVALGLLAATVALLADQISKAIALAATPSLARGIEILPILDLVRVRNRGSDTVFG